MKSDKSIIILGAGIGGLSAAIQLAYQGFSVKVLEKQEKPGGKIIQIKKDGFTFDGGASFITLSQVYEDFFHSVGKNRKDYFEWEKMQTNTTFCFSNDKKFTLYSEITDVRNEIKKNFPQDLNGFDRFMNMGKDIHSLLYEGPTYAKRNYHKFFGFDFLLHRNVFTHLKKLYIHKTWEQIVNECFTSPELRAVFSYQATFMGMRPTTALGTYIFLPWANITDGMYAIRGGTYNLVQGFYKLALELGVTFEFNTEVKDLVYTNKKITKVITTNGVRNCDIIVNNIDAAYFYTHIVPAEKNTFYTDSHLRKMNHTNSYFTINLGLRKAIPNINHHTFMVAEKWHDFYSLILEPNSATKFNKQNLCYYIMQPSITDSYMAPAGKATAFILVPVCGYDPNFNWIEYESTFKNLIYDCIEQRDNIPIRDLIEVEEIYSPARWGKEFNLWENIILGFSLDMFQINNFRMPNKAREFTNLYHVGGSTIPGPGLPTCVTSGQLVTERILEDYD